MGSNSNTCICLCDTVMDWCFPVRNKVSGKNECLLSGSVSHGSLAFWTPQNSLKHVTHLSLCCTEHCAAPPLCSSSTWAQIKWALKGLCRNQQHNSLQKPLFIFCSLSEIRIKFHNDMPVWVMNANPPSLFHLRIGAFISYLIMLVFVHWQMGNTQAREHFDLVKIQLWPPNGLILHWCGRRSSFHTDRFIHIEHVPLPALLTRNTARSIRSTRLWS